MNNCLLCKHCRDDSESVDGYPVNPCYICYKRELENDNRFPYKNTNCKSFNLDTSLTSLILKEVPKELMDLIKDKIIED